MNNTITYLLIRCIEYPHVQAGNGLPSHMTGLVLTGSPDPDYTWNSYIKANC